MNGIEAVTQRPLHIELYIELPLSKEEVQKASSALNCGKTGGRNGLTPELVKHVERGFADHILQLLKAVWVDAKEMGRCCDCCNTIERGLECL